jgi:hypothetical protein
MARTNDGLSDPELRIFDAPGGAEGDEVILMPLTGDRSVIMEPRGTLTLLPGAFVTSEGGNSEVTFFCR